MGLYPAAFIDRMKARGIRWIATATTVTEARLAVAAGADAVDRIPYMAPSLVGPEKTARGKFPTDTWWHTIVPTNSHEKTGYPTQKPLGILSRIVVANEGGSAVFFVSNNKTGSITIKDSLTQGNPRGTFETPDLPGFYVIANGPAPCTCMTVSLDAHA